MDTHRISKWWRLLALVPVAFAAILVASIMARSKAHETPTEPAPPNMVKVKGYKTKSGVEVREHYRTRPDTSRDNNLGGR